MYNMFFLLLLIILIPLLMFMINIFISKKKMMNYEKMSPFECGFDPLSFSRLPFSVQFFLISIIFLIFDTEIILLIPLITMTSMPNKLIITLTLMFMFILLYGLYIEYLENSIEWKN